MGTQDQVEWLRSSGRTVVAQGPRGEPPGRTHSHLHLGPVGKLMVSCVKKRLSGLKVPPGVYGLLWSGSSRRGPQCAPPPKNVEDRDRESGVFYTEKQAVSHLGVRTPGPAWRQMASVRIEAGQE